MVCKHVSTGYSSTDVVQESLFLQKKRAPTQSAESGIFRCYRKLRKFRGVINFVVFADTTIPRNLILGWALIYNKTVPRIIPVYPTVHLAIPVPVVIL